MAQTYTEYGDWIIAESDELYRLGLSDEVKQQIGKLIYIEFPPVGTALVEGSVLAVAEALKLSFEIVMPFDGQVVDCHIAINNQLERFNQLSETDEDSWLFKLKKHSPL